ncbi:hypothetical protein ACS0TY_030376 [Phlomoides rotata]
MQEMDVIEIMVAEMEVSTVKMIGSSVIVGGGQQKNVVAAECRNRDSDYQNPRAIFVRNFFCHEDPMMQEIVYDIEHMMAQEDGCSSYLMLCSCKTGKTIVTL